MHWLLKPYEFSNSIKIITINFKIEWYKVNFILLIIIVCALHHFVISIYKVKLSPVNWDFLLAPYGIQTKIKMVINEQDIFHQACLNE